MREIRIVSILVGVICTAGGCASTSSKPHLFIASLSAADIYEIILDDSVTVPESEFDAVHHLLRHIGLAESGERTVQFEVKQDRPHRGETSYTIAGSGAIFKREVSHSIHTWIIVRAPNQMKHQRYWYNHGAPFSFVGNVNEEVLYQRAIQIVNEQVLTDFAQTVKIFMPDRSFAEAITAGDERIWRLFFHELHNDWVEMEVILDLLELSSLPAEQAAEIDWSHKIGAVIGRENIFKLGTTDDEEIARVERRLQAVANNTFLENALRKTANTYAMYAALRTISASDIARGDKDAISRETEIKAAYEQRANAIDNENTVQEIR